MLTKGLDRHKLLLGLLLLLSRLRGEVEGALAAKQAPGWRARLAKNAPCPKS